MTLGWYVHHHGAGHVTRFLAVRPHLDLDVHVFSSLPAPRDLPGRTRWTVLARDDDPIRGASGVPVPPTEAEPTAHGAFHWAPLRHPGHRERLAALAAAAHDEPLAGMVVDVSVEVTLLSRLLGVPTVVVSQPGDRTDAPHELAYRAADRILAPWPEGVLADAALTPVRERVRWVGGVSRFGDRAHREESDGATVLVLGAHPELDRAAIQAGAESLGMSYAEVGASPETWTADPWPSLLRAEVVVSATGQNSVADLAAARARVVAVPQARPFDEQLATAEALERLGLAVVASPGVGGGVAGVGVAEWRELIVRARALKPRWELWCVEGAAARAAEAIREVVS